MNELNLRVLYKADIKPIATVIGTGSAPTVLVISINLLGLLKVWLAGQAERGQTMSKEHRRKRR